MSETKKKAAEDNTAERSGKNVDASATSGLVDFRAGLGAMNECMQIMLQLGQAIGREQSLLFREETAVLSGEADGLRRLHDTQEMARYGVRCAQLQADVAVHGTRAMIDMSRNAWFEMMSAWTRALLPSPAAPHEKVAGSDASDRR